MRAGSFEARFARLKRSQAGREVLVCLVIVGWGGRCQRHGPRALGKALCELAAYRASDSDSMFGQADGLRWLSHIEGHLRSRRRSPVRVDNFDASALDQI